MADVGDIQVSRTSHWERRWGAGVNDRSLTMDVCGWGGDSKEGETNHSENDIRKRWGRRDRLKVLSISDKSLVAEGSMAEVGISPPRNSEKPHAPVA